MKEKLSRRDKINIILERDGASCAICFKGFDDPMDATLEHWIPRAAGGTEDFDNLKVAHKKCNAWKGDRIPNPDGTIPPRVSTKKKHTTRRDRRSLRQTICQDCNNGRLLARGQICVVCNSEPSPAHAPHWAKKPANLCLHGGQDWCWACSIGIVERQSAMMHLITG
jgi:hypothetical protein